MINTLSRTALFLSCAAIAFPAAAEESAPQGADLLPSPGPILETQGDPILVTGDVLQSNVVASVKTPTPIIDVPQSLSITTDEQITERGWTSIGEIIDYTPGVNNSQGEGHRDAIVFRGVRSTADFFIDGVRDDVQYYRGLYNLEQVEILRGPNALLFGRGGTGGVLNRVTKKGALGETFGGGQVAIDTFGAFSIQGDINLSASDTAAFRLNASYEQLNNHRDFFDGERIGVNPTARFALGDAKPSSTCPTNTPITTASSIAAFQPALMVARSKHWKMWSLVILRTTSLNSKPTLCAPTSSTISQTIGRVSSARSMATMTRSIRTSLRPITIQRPISSSWTDTLTPRSART